MRAGKNSQGHTPDGDAANPVDKENGKNNALGCDLSAYRLVPCTYTLKVLG